MKEDSVPFHRFLVVGDFCEVFEDHVSRESAESSAMVVEGRARVVEAVGRSSAMEVGSRVVDSARLNELERAEEAMVKIRQLSADARSSDFYQRKYLLDQIDVICGAKP